MSYDGGGYRPIFDQLPDRGWGVIRGVPEYMVLLYQVAGWIKVQITGTPNVYQARLTGAGRKLKARQHDQDGNRER